MAPGPATILRRHDHAMSAILFEQTSRTLTRELRRWSRRLRLIRSALWGPRGVLVGLAVGVIVALISRVRPWLLPEQIAWATGLFTLGVLMIVLGWLWLRPQPVQRAARYFDRRFALQERTSTALELTGGAIPAPPALFERQLDDAVRRAQAVNVSAHLPLRLRWLELAAMLALGALLAALLLTHNPQTRQLLAERALEQAIANQAASLERQLEEIDRNSALTPEEQEALRRPLGEALEVLRQQDLSQQEAIAALSEAQQQLREMSDGMLEGERRPYRDAARALAGAEALSDLARALDEPDLGAAASAAEQAARDLDQTSAAEREAMAERLEQAANALSDSDVALGEQMREAAEALRKGDLEQAQESMREAAESLRDQQAQQEQSAAAEQAQRSADEARSGQQEIAQAGQDSATQPRAQSGPQSEQTGAAASQGQQAQLDDQGQPGESGEQAEQRADASGEQQGAAEPSDQGSQSDQPGEAESAAQGQPNAGSQSGEQPPQGAVRLSQEGAGEAAEQTGPLGALAGEQASGEGPGAEESDQSAQAPGSEQNAAQAAGQGEGGAGVDTTQGQASEQGEVPSGGGGDGDAANPRAFDPQYAPSSIGGTSQNPIDVGGQLSNENTLPSQEGEFAENPAGQSRLAYQRVLGDYRGFVSQALESGRIPLVQRDIIHDYFSSLEP